MSRAYVFVEAPIDAEFLRRLLTPEVLEGVQFISAGGYSKVASLARSLLVSRRNPVAVFLDADSINPDVVQERRQNMEELIKAAAANVPAKVIFAVPQIEAILFSSPEVIEKLFPDKVPSEFLSLGRRDPVGVLQVLAGRKNTQWDLGLALQTLDAQDMDRMRFAPPIRELSNFLQSLIAIEANA